MVRHTFGQIPLTNLRTQTWRDSGGVFVKPCVTRACAHARVMASRSQGETRAWQENLIISNALVQKIALEARRVAVLGIKTERQAGQPAFEVAVYLQRDGVEVIPVPVFYPDVVDILGVPVYRKLQDVPGYIDILNVFRKPSDVAAHLKDILEIADRVGCVWLQSGITEPATEEALARAGVRVISDRCLMVERRMSKL